MLGYHVSKNGRHLVDAVAEEMINMKMAGITNPCFQVFFSGPRTYKPTVDKSAAAALRKYTIFVHGAYVDYMNDSQKSIDNIRRELALCDIAGASGLILHLGANMRPQRSLAAALEGSQTSVYLEINAQRAPNWADPVALYDLFESMASEDFYDRLGICIDTQHLYACGVALRTAAEFNKYISRLRQVFINGGINVPPIMFHLNDSDPEKDLYGKGVDLHAEIGKGSIWANTNSGCMALMAYAKEHNLPIILESKNPQEALAALTKMRALPY